MKQSIIKSQKAAARVAKVIESKLNGELSIFSDAPTVKIHGITGIYWYEMFVANEKSNILTFSEIDVVRKVLDEYKMKYKGMFYIIDTRLYLASDNQTWLHRPVIEINLRIYEDEK